MWGPNWEDGSWWRLLREFWGLLGLSLGCLGAVWSCFGTGGTDEATGSAVGVLQGEISVPQGGRLINLVTVHGPGYLCLGGRGSQGGSKEGVWGSVSANSFFFFFPLR